MGLVRALTPQAAIPPCSMHYPLHLPSIFPTTRPHLIRLLHICIRPAFFNLASF
jgi:hypothetical protein